VAKTKRRKEETRRQETKKEGRKKIKRRKWQSLTKWPKNWFLKDFTSGFISLERKQVREYQ